MCAQDASMLAPSDGALPFGLQAAAGWKECKGVFQGGVRLLELDYAVTGRKQAGHRLVAQSLIKHSGCCVKAVSRHAHVGRGPCSASSHDCVRARFVLLLVWWPLENCLAKHGG